MEKSIIAVGCVHPKSDTITTRLQLTMGHNSQARHPYVNPLDTQALMVEATNEALGGTRASVLKNHKLRPSVAAISVRGTGSEEGGQVIGDGYNMAAADGSIIQIEYQTAGVGRTKSSRYVPGLGVTSNDVVSANYQPPNAMGYVASSSTVDPTTHGRVFVISEYEAVLEGSVIRVNAVVGGAESV